MSQILKSFMGLFLILTMVVISAGILSAHLSLLTAQNTHLSIITELQDSNYSKPVIDGCFDMAEGNGYGLTVILYGEDGTERECRSKQQVPEDTKGVVMARVELEYGYDNVFLAMAGRSVLRAYAR